MFNPIIATMIRHSGRSWWQARYSSGKVLSEWDTGVTLLDKTLFPLLVNSKSSRWEQVSKKGIVGLRLLCPNGIAGELEAPEGFKFFQLKVGYFSIAIGKSGSNRSIGAHIIGVVQDAEGNCLCRAWDYRTRSLLQFMDNIYEFKFENIGRLNLDVQQLRV